MNSRDLKYFIELVELRNYTQVAKAFKVSQPTITQAVQRLEKEFQTKLVNSERNHRDDMITRSGILLYENAKVMLGQLSTTHQEIERSKHRQIQIGIPPIIGKMVISQVVEKLQPQLLKRLKIISMGSHELLTEVTKGHLDLALIASTEPLHVSQITAYPLAALPFKLIVSEHHPLAQYDQLSFAQLGQERFINFDQQYIHQLAFQTYCDYTGVKPSIAVYRIPDISWVKELVRQNYGISLMVEKAVRNEPGIKVIELTDEVPIKFYISLVIRQSYVMSPEEQDIVEDFKAIDFS